MDRSPSVIVLEFLWASLRLRTAADAERRLAFEVEQPARLGDVERDPLDVALDRSRREAGIGDENLEPAEHAAVREPDAEAPVAARVRAERLGDHGADAGRARRRADGRAALDGAD